MRKGVFVTFTARRYSTISLSVLFFEDSADKDQCSASGDDEIIFQLVFVILKWIIDVCNQR